ncbi:hypothetical protein [Mycoplasma buteonis]|uniref:hypothetical protein n=1 Tax=Mycoplasma buteonis TaxID=171280 RepID=UPI00056A95F1|nr:hypothetical protein [Mycoplasma buteonis]
MNKKSKLEKFREINWKTNSEGKFVKPRDKEELTSWKKQTHTKKFFEDKKELFWYLYKRYYIQGVYISFFSFILLTVFALVTDFYLPLLEIRITLILISSVFLVIGIIKIFKYYHYNFNSYDFLRKIYIPSPDDDFFNEWIPRNSIHQENLDLYKWLNSNYEKNINILIEKIEKNFKKTVKFNKNITIIFFIIFSIFYALSLVLILNAIYFIGSGLLDEKNPYLFFYGHKLDYDDFLSIFSVTGILYLFFASFLKVSKVLARFPIKKKLSFDLKITVRPNAITFARLKANFLNDPSENNLIFLLKYNSLQTVKEQIDKRITECELDNQYLISK